MNCCQASSGVNFVVKFVVRWGVHMEVGVPN